MPGGVEIDVSAALARTIEDINKASDENLEHHLLVLCPAVLAPERGEQCWDFTFWVCLFDGPPIFPNNKQSQQTGYSELQRWNHVMMLNESSFLTGDES